MLREAKRWKPGRPSRYTRAVPHSFRASGFVRGAAGALLALGVALSVSQSAAFVWPNVPEQIARSLLSGDVSERRLAAQKLSELPRETALKLAAQAMSDADVEVRLKVAQAVIALRMPKAGDLVIGWLSEGDVRLRLAACDVIRAASTDRSVTALGRVLADPDAHVRLSAAAAMGGSGLADAVSPLLGHLDDPTPEVRAEVARALGRIGDARAVVPLIGKVQDSTPEVRKSVARALGELGDLRATSALLLALADNAQDVRVEAVTALGKLRSDEATLAITPLVEGSDTPDTTGLPVFGPRPQSGAGTNEVRNAALRALGRIGSESAVKVLISALAKDDPATRRSPVREALVAAGKPAHSALIAALSASPNQNTAAGAALALGALKASEGKEPIVRGMQRGLVPLKYGLRALADLGDKSALPTVLEILSDADPTVRKEAIRTASSLLDPKTPDGRAVDPASAALSDPRTAADEKLELVELLGRTGSERAAAILLPMVKAKSQPLRLAVLEALGTLHSARPDIEKALLDALSDDSGDVRLHAAMALSRSAGNGAASVLLDKLTIAAEQDRGALGIALSGALSRSDQPALADRVQKSLASAPNAARDSLLEGLGRMRLPKAGEALQNLISKGNIDDRRKIAEALAGHPERSAALLKLAEDADAGVRANAVWSLGTIFAKGSILLLIGLLRDPDTAVSGNAAASLGRIAEKHSDPSAVRQALCGALSDARAYVRANALTAMSAANIQCDSISARDLLARDPAESVRLAAADYLGRAIARAGEKADSADKRSLLRCAGEDKNASVAERCARPKLPPGNTDNLSVFVLGEHGSTPIARASFALVRADGFLRLGIADRRGSVFETGTPSGPVELAVPAPLIR